MLKRRRKRTGKVDDPKKLELMLGRLSTWWLSMLTGCGIPSSLPVWFLLISRFRSHEQYLHCTFLMEVHTIQFLRLKHCINSVFQLLSKILIAGVFLYQSVRTLYPNLFFDSHLILAGCLVLAQLLVVLFYSLGGLWTVGSHVGW